MNSLRQIFLSFLATLTVFTLVTYAACTKDKCEDVYCLNGGVCYSGECACLPQFGGLRCEVDKGPCALLECENGGNCVDGKCNCPTGYFGVRCENKVDSCNYIKCLNGSVCVDGTCQCPFGYTGKYCQNRIVQLYFKKYTGDGYDDKGNEYKNWYAQPTYGSGDHLNFAIILYNASQGSIATLPARLVSEGVYIIDEFDTNSPVVTYKGDGTISVNEMSLYVTITNASGTTKLSFEKLQAN